MTLLDYVHTFDKENNTCMFLLTFWGGGGGEIGQAGRHIFLFSLTFSFDNANPKIAIIVFQL